jgi:aryl-alcohol dehydrogenase-like predicted oxidoreductase
MDFRDEVVLATKFGFARLGQGLGLNSRPDNIRARSSTSA